MANKLMTFDAFAKEKTLQDPKKEALVSGGEDTLKKEKFVDQVKSADLSTALDIKEPDYTKTVDGKKLDEAADAASINAEIQTMGTQLTQLSTALTAAQEKKAAAESEITKIAKQQSDLNVAIQKKTSELNLQQVTAQGTSGAAATTQPPAAPTATTPAGATAPAAPTATTP